jgi:hypothetical protein
MRQQNVEFVMPDQFAYAAEEARQALEAVNSATDHGHKAFIDALGVAERMIDAAAKSAEHLLKEGYDGFRAQTASYTDDAWQHLDNGQRFVVDQVKQRPITFTLAGMGLARISHAIFA